MRNRVAKHALVRALRHAISDYLVAVDEKPEGQDLAGFTFEVHELDKTSFMIRAKPEGDQMSVYFEVKITGGG